MLAMDQGTSIYVLVFDRDGSLAGHPRLVRSSGFDDLDDAALTALTSAVPYPALPEDLAPDLRQLRVRFPYWFRFDRRPAAAASACTRSASLRARFQTIRIKSSPANSVESGNRGSPRAWWRPEHGSDGARCCPAA
jgi:hypothetical protein